MHAHKHTQRELHCTHQRANRRDRRTRQTSPRFCCVPNDKQQQQQKSSMRSRPRAHESATHALVSEAARHYHGVLHRFAFAWRACTAYAASTASQEYKVSKTRKRNERCARDKHAKRIVRARALESRNTTVARAALETDSNRTHLVRRHSRQRIVRFR